MWRDFRHGLRLLVRSPVFALTASLLLGIGIGANTLIFSVVDALLLRPLPTPHSEQLVRLIEVKPGNFITWSFPYGLCEHFPTKAAGLTEILCEGELDAAFESNGTTERIRVNGVSPNFFSTLGMNAAKGRVLLAEDDRAGSANAVVSYDFWHRRLAASGFTAGQSIRLNGRSFTVVGILPKGVNGFEVDATPEVRVPLSAARLLAQQPGQQFDLGFQIFGRLRPGVPPESADAQAEAVVRDALDEAETRARPRAPRRPKNQPPDSRLSFESAARGVSVLRNQFSRGLTVLMACVGLLLLMACGNVAGLLLARAAARSPEMNIRVALGASAWRLARQLLTESVALGLAGGAVGVAIAYSCLPLLLAAIPPIRDRAGDIHPLAADIRLNPRVLAFTLTASLLTTALFGLWPAVRGARLDLAGGLRGARTSTARLWGRNALVASQIALCILLLAGASLLVKTFENMRRMDPGFQPDRIVTFTVDPGLRGYTPERAKLLSLHLLERTRALPGVAGAAIASRGLMHGTGLKATMGIAGKPVGRADFLNTSLNSVTPGYFDAMGMRIVVGHDFGWTDPLRPKPWRAIVNQAFVRHFFPGQSALGRLFGAAGPDGTFQPLGEIVGVVSDAKYRSLREEVPPTQYSEAIDGFDGAFVLHVRTRGRPEEVIEPVRQTLRSLDPELPIVETATLRQEVETSLWQERLLAAFSGIFAGVAALLAGIGLYGAMDFAVKSRIREIGVRIALGADAVRVVRLIAREVLLLVTCGAAAGTSLFVLSERWIKGLLYGITAADPVAFGATVLLVSAVVFLASAAPVWRAIHIDPASALRHD